MGAGAGNGDRVHSSRPDGFGSGAGMTPPRLPGRIAERLDFLSVILASLLVFAVAHLPGFLSHWVINDDVRQQVYWMQQWREPGLYAGDLLTEYARLYVTWGVKAVYRLAVVFCDPLLFSKILPGLLHAPLMLGLFLVGRELGGRRVGWAAVAVGWLMPVFLDNMAGGLNRAFAAPLLTWFVLAWLRGSRVGLLAVAWLQALFIPYVFILCAGALGVSWLAGRGGWPRLGPPPAPRRPRDFIVLGLAAGVVVATGRIYDQAGFGPLVGLDQIVGRPEFGPAGRFEIYPVPSLLFELTYRPWEMIAPFREWGLVPGALACAAIVVAALWGLRRVDWRVLAPDKARPFLCLAVSSLGLFYAAQVLLLKLFVPSRYVEYTAALVYALLLALGLSRALGVAGWPRRVGVAALALAAMLGMARNYHVGLKDYRADAPVCAAVAALPGGALVAGHPDLMDNVLTFGRRPVLASYELAHPWSAGLWRRLEPRLRDLFAAYYAATPEEVRALAVRHGVTHLVVDDRHFTPAFIAGRPFFAPFDGDIGRLVGRRREFAALGDDVGPTRRIDDHRRLITLSAQ